MNSTLLKLVIIQIKDFLREPEIIFWAVLFPIGISGVLGVAFSQKEEMVRKVGVVMQQDTPEWREFQAMVDTVKFKFLNTSEKEAVLKLKRGEIQLYLVVAAGKITYHFDPQNGEAQLSYLLLEKSLAGNKEQGRSITPILAKGNRYIDFLIPGLLAMGIMNSCIWGIGWNLIDARIKKLLRRMVATPMKKSTFLAAHIITRLIVSFLEGLVLFTFAYLIFGVRIQGSFLALLLVFISGTFGFAGVAILASSRASNTQVGNGLINAVVLPFTILSGVFFSYHNFPGWAEKFVKYLPLTILADNLRAVFNEGAGIAAVFQPSIILILTGVVCFVAGLRIYKWY